MTKTTTEIKKKEQPKTKEIHKKRVTTHHVALEYLFGENFQQGNGVTVVPLEHLPDDQKQVPDALGLPAPQRSQEGLVFRGSRWGVAREVIDVAVKVVRSNDGVKKVEFLSEIGNCSASSDR